MSEKILTKEIAEQFIADEDSVDLTEFTKIDDDAAEVLSRFGFNTIMQTIWLDGLTELSDAAAKSLAKMAPDKLHLSDELEARVAQHR